MFFWLRLGPKLAKRGLRGVFLTFGNRGQRHAAIIKSTTTKRTRNERNDSRRRAWPQAHAPSPCWANLRAGEGFRTTRVGPVRRTPTSTSGMGSCVTSLCKHHQQAMQPSACKHHHQATITMQTSSPSNHHHANIITKQPSP